MTDQPAPATQTPERIIAGLQSVLDGNSLRLHDNRAVHDGVIELKRLYAELAESERLRKVAEERAAKYWTPPARRGKDD